MNSPHVDIIICAIVHPFFHPHFLSIYFFDSYKNFFFNPFIIAYFFLYFNINTVFLFLSLASPNYLFTTLFFNFQLTQSSLKLSGGLGYTVIDVGLSVSSSGIVLLILVEFFRIRCAYVLKSSPLRSMRYVVLNLIFDHHFSRYE